VIPIDLVNAYASVAARGFHAPPILVLRVRDRDGNVLEETQPAPVPGVAADGSAAPSAPLDAATATPIPAATATATPTSTSTVESTAVHPERSDAAEAAARSRRTPTATATDGSSPPAFAIPASGTRPDVAFVLTAMMRGVVEGGTGAGAKALARPVAAKTGTAQEHRDAWFVGFTPELVAGVWVGFDDHSPLGPRETGAGAALPPWLSFMQAALGARPAADFELVPGVELARIDLATGLLADRQADAPFAAFLAGTAPSESASSGRGSAPQNFFMDDR